MNNFRQYFFESHESIRVCSACEKELGPIITDKIKSHSLCKRHMLEQAKLISPDFVKKIENAPDSQFPPDLSNQ